MKKILFFVLLILPYYGKSQVTLNQIDDFEDYTMKNWVKNNSIPNQNIYDDGPLGVGDNFLRVISNGSGTGLELMTKNNAQWIGNYYNNNLSNRIKYISMDVRNSGTNVIFLRLSFGRNSSYTENWSSINAVAVLPGEGWKKVNFFLDASNFVRVTGLSQTSPDFSGAFSNIGELRILHNDAPAWNSDPIIATLDIDNIQASSQPVLSSENFDYSENLIIHPNPSNNFILVSSSRNNLFDNFEYSIVDLTGRIMKSGHLNLNGKIIIEDLKSGNYILQIKTDIGQIISKKIIKK